MLSLKPFGFAAAAFATALFASSPAAFAGGDCCGGKKDSGEVADKPGAGSEKAKGGCCANLGECDARVGAKTEAALAKLAAEPKLSEADAKALAAAKQSLASTCPAGQAITTALPALLEAVQAVRALDADVDAFHAKGGHAIEGDAKVAFDVSKKALARAEKIGLPLAALWATKGGDTTKPAGTPAAPTKETYEKLAARLQAAADGIVAGIEKAKTLPEADKKKIDEAVAALDKLTGGKGAGATFEAVGALFAELDLARKATAACQELCPSKKDPKFVEGLSPEGKATFALFTARANVVLALGGLTDAASSGKGCCDEEKKEPAGAKN